MTVPEGMTLDEIGASLEKPAGPNLDEIKVDGEDLPEELRGKSVSELLTIAKGAQQAVRISEQAREDLKARTAALEARISEMTATREAPAQHPAGEPGGEGGKALSDEELHDLIEKQPSKLLEVLTDRLAKHVDARMQPLIAGSAGDAESRAKQRYADEFALFGDEINNIVKRVPNPAALSTDKGWDDLISYVRGQPSNFDKLIEHRTKKRTDAAAEEARKAAAASTGFDGTSVSQRTPAPKDGESKLDDVEREVMRVQGVFKSEDEFLKWKKMGS